MATMRLSISIATALLATGCGAYYEDVPAFGQTDPNYVAVNEQRPQPQRGTVDAIGYDNQTQQGVDPGQSVNADAQDYSDTDPSALTDFKSTLDPYGTWADDSQYGTVWQPDAGVVGADFAPYVTGGHWSYDDEYTWVSDYDWGWAPFHYGRWVWIAGRGWCWIAGRRYAGAWVSWRVGPEGYGYVGWGPMAPSWYWRDGYAYGIGWGVSTPYSFCRTGDLFSPTLHGRVLAGPEVSVVANNTHAYIDGRTPAHPTVGPPLNHLGVTPPLLGERAPSITRALAYAHRPPGVPGAITHPTPLPSYPPHGAIGGGDHSVVTAPRFNGVAPRPWVRPYAPPVRSFGGGAPPYRAYGSAPPVYHGGAPPAYRGAPPPVYQGGGGGFHGGGGGGFGGYHPPSSSSYTHSHSYSHSGGGGHGGHR